MGDLALQRGYFSVLRWRSDATRDEARNLAVILVDAEGTIGGLRAASVASISPNLGEQGLLDTLVSGLEKRLAGPDRPDLDEIRRIQGSLQQSLYLTDPKPVAVADAQETLDSLYKALVARPAFAGSRTKGRVLTQLVRRLRSVNLDVTRDAFVDDYQFDALVQNGRGPVAVNVLTFAQAGRKDWRDAEYDASHFVFSVDKTQIPAVAVLEAPPEAAAEASQASYARVHRWYSDAALPVLDPAAVLLQPRLIMSAALEREPVTPGA